MKNKNIITFYIPTLNAEKTIKQCLDNILKFNSNVYVIDSGSSDNTLKIINECKVKLIDQKAKHLANARNIALNHCKTELIGFIDSDVIITKKWYDSILDIIKQKKITGVCGKLIEKNTKSLPDKWRAFHLKQHWGTKLIENPDFLFGANGVYKLKDLKRVNGYNETFKTNYEDVDISKRLKNTGCKLVYEPKAKCYHLKKDTYFSIIKSARRWSFYSYVIPDSFFNLIQRLVIYNPHYVINLLIKDIKSLRFELLLITFSVFLFLEIHDFDYYLKAP